MTNLNYKDTKINSKPYYFILVTNRHILTSRSTNMFNSFDAKHRSSFPLLSKQRCDLQIFELYEKGEIFKASCVLRGAHDRKVRNYNQQQLKIHDIKLYSINKESYFSLNLNS